MRGFHLAHWRRLAAAFGRDERGSVVAVVAGTMLVLLGFASFAIDVSALYVLQNELQIAADAAALAALRDLPNDVTARAKARDYASKNMPANVHGSVLTDGDIILGRWNQAARTFTAGATPYDAVKVTTRRARANANPAPTFFAWVFGISQVDLSAPATAAMVPGRRPWDIVVAQDVTSSFGAEIADARAADRALLDCVNSNTSGTSLVGMSIFTGVGAVHSPLQALQTGYGPMTAKINQLRVCGSAGMPACSGTNIAAGLNTAVDMFLASPPSNAGIQRAIVLVSDGEPNPTSLKPAAVAAATRADNAGISLFSVFYNRDNDPTARAFLASLARGQGIALSTPTASQLPTLLRQLCEDYAPGAFMLVG
jgi:Flp pilus assembly protein TadG